MELPATWAKRYCERLKDQSEKSSGLVLAEFISNTMPLDFLQKNNPSMAAAMEKNRKQSEGKAMNLPITAMTDVINSYSLAVQASVRSDVYKKLVGSFIGSKLDAADLVKVFCHKDVNPNEAFIPEHKAMITAPLKDYLSKAKNLDETKVKGAFPWLFNETEEASA